MNDNISYEEGYFGYYFEYAIHIPKMYRNLSEVVEFLKTNFKYEDYYFTEIKSDWQLSVLQIKFRNKQDYEYFRLIFNI